MISEFVETNWKLPKVEKEQEIRFLYCNRDMSDYRGFRGTVKDIRYLNHEPLKQESKKREMKRGSCSYLIRTPNGKCLTFYNYRMFNLEIIK